MEEGIIDDWMEIGLDFWFTTLMMNQHRIGKGKISVGRNALMNKLYRMNPVIYKVKKCCQSKRSAYARLNQCK